MSDLGKLVVLVGENGCGKTRMLEAVDWLLRRTRHVGHARLLEIRAGRQEKAAFFSALANDPDDHYTFAGAGHDLEAFDAMLSPVEGFELAWESGEDVDAALSAYCALADILRNSSIANREHFARLTVGVPRGDDPTDPLLVGAPLVYIDDICVRHAAALGDERIGFHSEHRMIDSEYARLQKLMSSITGMCLDIADGHASLDGRGVHRTTFSDGQMALFRIAVLVHSRVLENAAVPIHLDEPERHLHPSRLVGLIDALRTHLPHAQLWIATHSLSLTAHLAALEPRAIWFGSNGRFERAGLAQEKVVNGLLGGATGAEQISDFCVRADQFAACAFSADCLCPPEAVTYKEGDPQIQQIREFIAGKSEGRLTIVDIGAGQGRLLEGLTHALGDALADSVSYYAIEPNEVTRALCTERVSRHFDDGAARVFASAQDFLASVATRADVVVMANVLHEIEIEQWEGVLQDVHALLQYAGSLLVVEDTRLPRGELSHANGFLVLETEALCELFATEMGADGVQYVAAPRGGARLQATAFRRSHLATVTASSIKRALQLQRSITARSIRDLRKSDQKPNYRLGHEHAYHTQLLANLTLALEDLESLTC
ncbi:AAA family ATPase [Cupriavidus numazuensis]|nr:AAA family ATPase [Cupriavidus numazuensis]